MGTSHKALFSSFISTRRWSTIHEHFQALNLSNELCKAMYIDYSLVWVDTYKRRLPLFFVKRIIHIPFLPFIWTQVCRKVHLSDSVSGGTKELWPARPLFCPSHILNMWALWPLCLSTVPTTRVQHTALKMLPMTQVCPKHSVPINQTGPSLSWWRCITARGGGVWIFSCVVVFSCKSRCVKPALAWSGAHLLPFVVHWHNVWSSRGGWWLWRPVGRGGHS